MGLPKKGGFMNSPNADSNNVNFLIRGVAREISKSFHVTCKTGPLHLR